MQRIELRMFEMLFRSLKISKRDTYVLFVSNIECSR